MLMSLLNLGGTMKRQNISSGSPWEPLVGYSRAVKFGPYVHVSGTTAFNAKGEIVGAGDPYAQTIQAMRNIEDALTQAGAKMTDVVRTRLFLTHITDWKEIGRAHGEIFGKVRPACTIVEVNHLVAPEMLVEIEADAMIERE
jgi:enamine deaminase RidA (YjgF/YER057c/UK114 family)